MGDTFTRRSKNDKFYEANTADWIAKAEADFASVERMRGGPEPIMTVLAFTQAMRGEIH
jgi:hypothetical protein